MALVSMNVDDHDGDEAAPDGYDQSPRIYLSGAQCEALGITTPPRAGAVFVIHAQAEVTSSTERKEDGEDEPDVNLCLKLTHMEVAGQTTGEPSATLLYGG